MIDVIAFDADDTLWHNERLFTMTQEKFRQLLLPYHSAEWIDERLFATEMRNLSTFGYGIKGFTLSMIETAVELTEGRITGAEIQKLINFAKEMVAAPVDLLDHVRETVDLLAADYDLMLVTKGDLFDQESKLARSGLGDYFSRVEIVSEKNRAAYERIVRRHGLAPGRFVMIGNSLKSDILPVVEMGGRAVYIPYHTTWAHEAVAEEEVGRHRFEQLDHIGQLPALIRQMAGAAASADASA